MFTGIVEEKGRVARIQADDGSTRIVVDSSLEGLHVGDSIAVNGVCLTVVDVSQGRFSADVMHETLRRTNLGDLQAGGSVDLERPLSASGRFDGHIVQGHVDGVGEVEGIAPEGDSIRMTIGVPGVMSKYMVEKGSVTVDGVSLTIAGVTGDTIEVALIPHTLAVTVLGEREPGDRVNLEVDVIAKYVERLLDGRT